MDLRTRLAGVEAAHMLDQLARKDISWLIDSLWKLSGASSFEEFEKRKKELGIVNEDQEIY